MYVEVARKVNTYKKVDNRTQSSDMFTHFVCDASWLILVIGKNPINFVTSHNKINWETSFCFFLLPCLRDSWYLECEKAFISSTTFCWNRYYHEYYNIDKENSNNNVKYLTCIDKYQFVIGFVISSIKHAVEDHHWSCYIHMLSRDI